jgi:DNA invertase Pin-like site-specific DNA recombinase
MWVRSYARKSQALGDRTEEDICSHQLTECDWHAEQMGIHVQPEDRIAEIGSGERLKERPSLAAMLEDLFHDPPGTGYLFATGVVRLTGADMEEAGRIMRVLRHAGVRPVLAGRPYDLKKPQDEYYFSLLVINARLDRAQ